MVAIQPFSLCISDVRKVLTCGAAPPPSVCGDEGLVSPFLVTPDLEKDSVYEMEVRKIKRFLGFA